MFRIHFNHHFLLVFITFFLIGCAPIREMPSEVEPRYWNRIPKSEQSFYKDVRKHADSVPKLGLAFSGGGQRAASIAIGFLEAMHRSEKLKQVDIISSVSGGSYGAYWWYSKNYWLQNTPSNMQSFGDQDVFFRRFSYIHNRHKKDENYLCKFRNSLEGLEYTDKEEMDKKDKMGKKVIAVCPVDDEQITYEDFPYFSHLSSHGRLLTYNQKPGWLSIAELVVKAPALLPCIPLHWFVNGIFDMKANVNPYQPIYKYGIERDYGLFPVHGNYNDSYANFDDSVFKINGALDPSDEELFQTIRNQQLPFWVINTTAAYGTRPIPKMLRNGGEWTGYSSDLEHTVYEFTPLHQGSPWWGYCPEDKRPDKRPCDYETIKLSRKVAISGAAIDDLPEYANSLIDMLNFSLGQYIDNPYSSDSNRIVHRLLPTPLALMHSSSHNEKAPFIYLSDGGHSDNLGLYSLVRRKTKEIIVVDASQELNNESRHYAGFVDLQSTRLHLWKEHEMLLDIPEIFGDRPITDEPISPSILRFDYLKAKESVFKGLICKAKSTQIHCNKDDPTNLTLWYVKLSIDRDEITRAYLSKTARKGCRELGVPDNESATRYSCTTLLYAMKNPNTKCPKDYKGKCSEDSGKYYPHVSTVDLIYQPEQVSGYISLGYDLGYEFIVKSSKTSPPQ